MRETREVEILLVEENPVGARLTVEVLSQGTLPQECACGTSRNFADQPW